MPKLTRRVVVRHYKNVLLVGERANALNELGAPLGVSWSPLGGGSWKNQSGRLGGLLFGRVLAHPSGISETLKQRVASRPQRRGGVDIPPPQRSLRHPDPLTEGQAGLRRQHEHPTDGPACTAGPTAGCCVLIPDTGYSRHVDALSVWVKVLGRPSDPLYKVFGGHVAPPGLPKAGGRGHFFVFSINAAGHCTPPAPLPVGLGCTCRDGAVQPSRSRETRRRRGVIRRLSAHRSVQRTSTGPPR